MKTLKDGSILFSSSEKLPKNLPGYTPDKNNPYLFLPEPDPCTYREKVLREMPCGKLTVLYQCHLHKCQVTLAGCNECDDNL